MYCVFLNRTLFIFRVVLENSPDGFVPVWDLVCHHDARQHISGVVFLQER